MNNKLENKIKDLKDMLTDLLVEKEEMLTSEYQELNASYSQKLGKYELALYEREYEYIRLKKKIEMISSMQKNGEMNIDLYSLNLQLDSDYKDFKNRIESRRQLAKESEDFMINQQLNYNKYSKLRENYWNLVRESHPYLKLNANAEDKAKWVKINRAFEDKDYNKVETYALGLNYSEDKLSDEYQEELISHLEKKIKEAMTYMDSLKKLHPYNKKNLLESTREVYEKKEKILERTVEVNSKIMSLENDLIDLLIK